MDSRGSKGHFLCADGRWIQNWVPNPAFTLGVSSGDRLDPEGVNAPREDPSRIGPDYSELVVLAHYHPQMAAAYARFPAEEWVEVAAEVGVPLQRVRSVEEALADPDLFDAGMVVEVDDPEVGPIRHAGVLIRMDATPGAVQGPAPAVGQHTEEILAELGVPAEPHPGPTEPRDLSAPLAGVVVLDLGLAIAGPWGTQVLSDLGATVIKVNTLWDDFWHATHIAFCANRGKQSISMNLKDPKAMEILHRLVERADVVQHNMRYEAAVRLGVDDESLRKIKPDLVYCHTAGFDPSRAHLPGNDQTGACLVRHRVRGRRRGRGRQADLEPHLVRRHRQRLPLGHRHHPGPAPPRPHRRGPVPHHQHPRRRPAQHLLRLDRRRRQRRRAPAPRPRPARSRAAPTPLRHRRRLALPGRRRRGPGQGPGRRGRRARPHRRAPPTTRWWPPSPPP